MTKEEGLVRSIMGTGKTGRRDLRIFIYAVKLMEKMLFEEGFCIEEIQVTKSIYPEAGRSYGKSAETAARQIERLGALCFREMPKTERKKYFGEEIICLSPREILFHLAYYSRLGKSYEEVLHEEMENAWSGTQKAEKE